MGGVGRSDQFNSYFMIANSTMKWWKKAFYHLLVTAATNAFILYRKDAEARAIEASTLLRDREFRLEIVKKCAKKYTRPGQGQAPHQQGEPLNRMNGMFHKLEKRINIVTIYSACLCYWQPFDRSCLVGGRRIENLIVGVRKQQYNQCCKYCQCCLYCTYCQ